MRFRNYIIQNFPFLEDDFDALTDYQLFCKMVGYVKKLYINNEKLLKEITANLEQMYEDGKFDSLIEEIVNLETTFTFDTVSDMKSATNLVNGCYTKTLGYNTIYDGGNAYYKVRNKTNEDVIDEVFIIEIDENLVADLIVLDNEVNVKQSGLTGLSSEDATSKLGILVSSGYDLYFPDGTYNTTNQLSITCHSLRGEKNSTIKYNDEETNKQLIETTGINKLNIANLIFDCGGATDSTKSAINLYSCNDIKIKNCEFKNGYGTHLRLNGSDTVLIEDCYFHDISGTTGNMGNAIYCHPVKNLTIKKCVCTNLHEDFLYLDGTEEDPVINVLVTNCYLKNTGYENIQTSANAIGINGDCRDIFINDNVISNNINGIKTASRYDIIPSNVFISKNVICNNSQNGVGLSGNSITFIDNQLYNNSQDGSYFVNANNVLIKGNISNNNTRNGIYLNSVNNGIISDCIVYDNTASGIVCGVNNTYTCSNITISNCQIYKTSEGTQGTGLQLLYVNTAKVLSNLVYNNTVDYDLYRTTVTNLTSQFSPTQGQSTVKSVMFSNAIPSNGTYNTGDVILFTTPTAGGYIGAVCVSGGSPGTWKTFGTISS